MDQNKEHWLRQIKEFWYEKEKAGLRLFLSAEVFPSCGNPFLEVVELLESCPDVAKPKRQGIAFLIADAFRAWVQEGDSSEELRRLHLSRSVRAEAFAQLTTTHVLFLEAAVDVYAFWDDPAEDYVLPRIRRFISDGNFKDAAIAAALLKVADAFTLAEIALPCLLQEKHAALEQYLDGQRRLQVEEELTARLDSLIGPTADVGAFVEEQTALGVTGIARDKLEGKTIQKLITRLLKLYCLPGTLAPNLALARSEGALRFLIFQRYTQKSISEANWEDMVRSAVGECPGLAPYLLLLLCRADDVREAAKWAVELKLDSSELPKSVVAWLDANPEFAHSFESLDGLAKLYPTSVKAYAQ